MTLPSKVARKHMKRKIWEKPPVRFPELKNYFLTMAIIAGVFMGVITFISTGNENLTIISSLIPMLICQVLIWRFT